MHLKYIYKVLWILCSTAILSALPLPETQAAPNSSVSDIYAKTDFSSLEVGRHREKRQLSSYLWNNEMIQSLSKAISNSFERIRGAVNNGSVSDSPIIRMVNDFSTRLAPLVLRTIYMSAIQNVWNQIRDQARTNVNEFFDNIGSS